MMQCTVFDTLSACAQWMLQFLLYSQVTLASEDVNTALPHTWWREVAIEKNTSTGGPFQLRMQLKVMH